MYELLDAETKMSIDQKDNFEDAQSLQAILENAVGRPVTIVKKGEQ